MFLPLTITIFNVLGSLKGPCAGWTCLALCHIEARAVFSLVTEDRAIGGSDQVQEVARSNFTECLIFCSCGSGSVSFLAAGASNKAPPLTVGTNAASNGALGLGVPTCNPGTSRAANSEMQSKQSWQYQLINQSTRLAMPMDKESINTMVRMAIRKQQDHWCPCQHTS